MLQLIGYITRELEKFKARRIAKNKSMCKSVESPKARVNNLIASGMHCVPHSPPCDSDDVDSDYED